MNSVKVYTADGKFVNTFIKPSTHYYRYGKKDARDMQFPLQMNKVVRMLNAKGFYLKRQLKGLKKKS